MSDLRRLMDEGGSEAELALLRAARSDGPPDGAARARTLAALAAGAAAVGTASAGTAGLAAVVSKLFSSTVAKVLVVLAIGGGVGATILMQHRAPEHAVPSGDTPKPVRVTHGMESAEPSAPVATASPLATTTTPEIPAPVALEPAQTRSTPTPTPAPPALAPPATPAVVAAPTVARATGGPAAVRPHGAAMATASAPTPSATPVPASGPGVLALGGAAPGPTEPVAPPPPSPPSASLSSEVALLDSARAALAAHDPAGALDAVARYDRAFPGGVFVPEARILRIQALLQAGDRARAQALAGELLRADPNGPYAKRVREMIAK